MNKKLLDELKKTNIPIIECDVDERTQYLSFKCFYCKKKHFHGEGEGYRQSHCINSKSPYYNKNYYLIIKSEEEIKK